MMTVLIVFVIFLVLAGASALGGDNLGFVVASVGTALSGCALLAGTVMIAFGVPGVTWSW